MVAVPLDAEMARALAGGGWGAVVELVADGAAGPDLSVVGLLG